MEIAVLVGAKAVIGYTAVTIGTWEKSPPVLQVRATDSVRRKGRWRATRARGASAWARTRRAVRAGARRALAWDVQHRWRDALRICPTAPHALARLAWALLCVSCLRVCACASVCRGSPSVQQQREPEYESSEVSHIESVRETPRTLKTADCLPAHLKTKLQKRVASEDWLPRGHAARARGPQQICCHALLADSPRFPGF